MASMYKLQSENGDLLNKSTIEQKEFVCEMFSVFDRFEWKGYDWIKSDDIFIVYLRNVFSLVFPLLTFNLHLRFPKNDADITKTAMRQWPIDFPVDEQNSFDKLPKFSSWVFVEISIFRETKKKHRRTGIITVGIDV